MYSILKKTILVLMCCILIGDFIFLTYWNCWQDMTKQMIAWEVCWICCIKNFLSQLHDCLLHHACIGELALSCSSVVDFLAQKIKGLFYSNVSFKQANFQKNFLSILSNTENCIHWGHSVQKICFFLCFEFSKIHFS